MKNNEEKQDVVVLTEEQLDYIVEKVTARLETRMYIAVGKTVLEKLFLIVGLGVGALGAWIMVHTDSSFWRK